MGRLILRADLPDDPDARKDLLTGGLEAGITRFILREGDEALESLGKMDVMYTRDGEFTDGSRVFISIDTPEDQAKALSYAGSKKTVAVRTSDWTVIPLENMIAGFGGSGTELLACASDAESARLFLTTMEKGADGVIIAADDPLKIGKMVGILTESRKESLSELTVVSVVPAEMGDRVCIDTCSLMVPGEGMLIGSYSNCLFLVQSESEENGYVASRPFRVNAGAVYAYIEVPGGKTRYLSEISAGDPVLLCDRSGNTRIASVGRCKVEKRPLLMLTATDGTRNYSVMLQNAETIRLVMKEGSESVTRLRPGDKILAKTDTGGRHFGMAVEETITEK